MSQTNQKEILVAGTSSEATATAYAAVASNAIQETRLPYLKLIVDCWVHILDNLSFNDILQLAQTCKRMNRLAGYYFSEYLDLQCSYQCSYRDDLGYNFYDAGFGATNLHSDFYQFIRELKIYSGSFELKIDYTDCIRNAQAFSSLKRIVLDKVRMVHFQSSLNNVELLELSSDGEVYEPIAKYCPKLKYLIVTDESDVSDRLYSEYHPSLEYLKHRSCKINSLTPLSELKTFLEKHSKLKHFETDFCFLWANRDLLLETNVQLDSLGIYLVSWCETTLPFDQFSNYLKRLYARGFYKSLHLRFLAFGIYDQFDRISFDTLSALPSLESMKNIPLLSTIDIPHLENLKELHINHIEQTLNMEYLAKKLVKLERLTIWSRRSDVLAFIRYSKKLKKLTTDPMDFYTGDKWSLDAFAWNEERKKLENACQVSIHVREEVYLSEKWKSKYLCFSHVKITRSDGSRDERWLVPINFDHS